MPKFIRNKMLQIPVIVSLLIVSGSLLAQVITGAISGTVTDATGAAVSGATVTVTNQATNVSTTLTTDSRGFYSAEGLPVGQYTIDISKAGFKENITRGIQLNPGQRRASNIVLKVGAETSKVTVVADTEQVNTITSESSGTLSSKQISNLMLNGRNFQTLEIAIPGVSSTAGADSLTAFSPSTIVVNGTSANYSVLTIDGIQDSNVGGAVSINVLPILDGIEEFTVLKDNYSAKYAYTGAAIPLIETKSGTETYHGSAWDYLRNNSFDANNFYTTSTQALHQNIFGYTLGGPLIIRKLYNGRSGKKKTFFFASNQWYLINAGGVARGAVFPQAMRNGNFSASPTLKGSLHLDANSQAILASEGKLNCISGPTTLNPACFDPVAVALMNAYIPLPNNAAAGFLNYLNQGSQRTSEIQYQFRVDHYINENNLLTTRIDYQNSSIDYPDDSWNGIPFSTVTDSEYQPAFNGLVRLQSSFTPNLLNTIGAAETYGDVNINTTHGGSLPSGISITQSFPNAPIMNRIPDISIARGWTGLGVNSEPVLANTGDGQLSDDASWVKGDHVLQVGALYIFGIKRQNAQTVPQGSFTFTGVHTGDPAADYLLGLDTTYSQINTQNLGNFHYRQGEAYVQDDWRVSPRLTLNLGVRWQYFSNDTASGDHVTSFNPALYNPAQAPVVNINGTQQVNSKNQPVNATGQPANLLNGLAFAGKNGVPSGFFIPAKTNFGPRVGFAYDVFGDGKTSIRGGYGIGYYRIALNQIYSAWSQNPPYNLSANILNSTLSNGTLGTAAAPTPQLLNNVPFNFVPSQLQSYSLTLEQQVNANMVATLAYAGSQGRHLETFNYDTNFPLPVAAPSTGNCLAPGQGASISYDFDPCINTGQASPNYTRPYKGYDAMYGEYQDGTSNYNSLQSGLTYRTGSSQFSLAYTWSKALGTINTSNSMIPARSDGAGAQNPRNWHAEYGPPSYDFTNDIAATWVYSIPYFSHSSKPVALAFGNWSFAGLALYRSGFASSPGLVTSTAGLASRPNQIKPIRRVGTLKEWFDTSAFSAPNYGFFGNASVGTIRGPGYTSFNLSLYKTFPITSRLDTQFRAEAFNVANHPNFFHVNTNFGSGAYGQVTSAGDPRILEFALKVLF